MDTVQAPKVYHEFQAALLTKAASGDASAANDVFLCLISPNQALSQMMTEAIHDLCNPAVWSYLLDIYGALCSGAKPASPSSEKSAWHIDASASKELEHALKQAFIQDKSGGEEAIKQSLLLEVLAGGNTPRSSAAACLLGNRGDARTIPRLDEIIRTSEIGWKLRAIQALAELKDERSAFPLMKALAMDRGVLHAEARRALWKLGKLAAPAFKTALSSNDSHIRWHAAHGLGESGDSTAAALLAEGLYDENDEVRWASARALAQLNGVSVPAILDVICRHPMNEQFRQAVCHSLNSLSSGRSRQFVQPLMAALNGPAAALEAPAIAHWLRSRLSEMGLDAE